MTIIFNKDLDWDKLFSNTLDPRSLEWDTTNKQYWKGKEIISAEDWLDMVRAEVKTNNNHCYTVALNYFPETFIHEAYWYKVPDDLKEYREKWRAEWHELLRRINDEKYRKAFNPTEEEKAADGNRKF
jgi:hypothetical protein